MTEKPFDKRKWLTIVGFACFTLGVLTGVFIVWVNETWRPISVWYF